MYTSKARKTQYDTVNMLLDLRNMNLSVRGRPVEQFNDRVEFDVHIRELKTVKCALCGDVSADDDDAKRQKEFGLMRSCYGCQEVVLKSEWEDHGAECLIRRIYGEPSDKQTEV